MSGSTPLLPPTNPVDVALANAKERASVPAAVVRDEGDALPPPRDRPQRVPAEIIARREDGSVRVKTPRGEVELRPEAAQAKPQRAAQTPPPEQQLRPQPSPEQPAQNAPREQPQRPTEQPAQVRISAAAVGARVEIEIPPLSIQRNAQTAALKAEQVILRLEAALVRNVSQATIEASRAAATPLQITLGQPAAPIAQAAPLSASAAPEIAVNPQTGLPQIGETVRLVPLTQDFITSLRQPAVTNLQATSLPVLPASSLGALPVLSTASASILSTPQNIPAPQIPVLSALPSGTATLSQAPPQNQQIENSGVQNSRVQIQTALQSLPATTVLPASLAAPSQPISVALSPIPNTIFMPGLPDAAPLAVTPQAFFTPALNLLAPAPAAPIPGTDDAANIRAIAAEMPRANGREATAEQRPHNVPARFEGLAPQGQPVFSVQFPQHSQSLMNAPPPLYIMDYALSDGTRAALENLPQGLRATLSFAQPNAAQAMQTATSLQATLAAPAALPAFSTYLTPGLWPAANDLFQSVQQVSAGASAMMANTTPNPGNAAQFGPAVMFFVAALRSGDLSGWLGDKNIEMLQKAGKGGQLSRLLGDGQGMSRLAFEPVSQDWRAMSIPVMNENKIEKIALYYKHDDGGDEGDDKKSGGFKRFIFNLNLDQMGQVQLDGLFRGKKLDLAVRTSEPFSSAMRMDMRRIYVHTLEVAGMNGELSFQNALDNWVTINPEKDRFGVNA